MTSNPNNSDPSDPSEPVDAGEQDMVNKPKPARDPQPTPEEGATTNPWIKNKTA